MRKGKCILFLGLDSIPFIQFGKSSSKNAEGDNVSELFYRTLHIKLNTVKTVSSTYKFFNFQLKKTQPKRYYF